MHARQGRSRSEEGENTEQTEQTEKPYWNFRLFRILSPLIRSRKSFSENEIFGVCITKELPISGGELDRNQLAAIAEQIAESEEIGIEAALHLVYAYGSDHTRLIELIRGEERLREPLVEGLPVLAAEIVYAARYEMVMTLADAMTRRTRLAMLAGKDSIKCASVAADLLARELGWDKQESRRQIEQFIEELEREFAVPNKN